MYRSLRLSVLLAASALAAPALAADAPAIPAAAGAMPVGPLSDAVTPQAYRLDLTVDPAKDRFSGHTEIDATLKAPSRYIWMHGRDLAVSRVTASVDGKVLVGTFTQEDPTGVALLSFPEDLPAGKVTLAFDYDAPFGDTASGLYHIKVGDKWYAWTQFESIDARSAFPGFDQPGFKTPFTVTLRTPAGESAVSNAPETATETDGGMTVHRFAPTEPLPTYLVAMMAGPFAIVSSEVPPTPERATPLPLRVVSTQTNKDSLQFALDNSKAIVAHLENYFGMPFPFPKLDQITSPVMPGAMENAGADVYGDSILVMDDKAPTSQKRLFGMVVAHELSHQWFGDLVTPAWWDDIWLNESFANWMGYRIGGEWRPDLNIAAGALAEGFAAMNTDALIAGRPIHQPITRNSQIDAAFDSITYGKGGQVVAMVAGYLGDTRFRDGVRAYMHAHKYGNATSADFFGSMAKVAGDPRLLKAMQSFTDQQGVPLVTFSGGKDGVWTVTQSRYVRLGTPAPDTQWGIPLCVRQGTVRQCTLVTDRTATITIKGRGPLMPNAGGTGYYRFELPKAEWDKLIAAAPGLPGPEGLALADSIAASFYAGRASAAELIAASRALAHNPDSYASGNSVGALESMAYRGIFAGSGRAGYQRLIEGIFKPQLAKLGFDPRAEAYAGEDPDQAQRRTDVVGVLASEARDPVVLAKLDAAARGWLGGDRAALDSAYYHDAFSAYARAGGLEAAKHLVEQALTSEDPVARPTLLAAASGNGDQASAHWLLDTLKDPRLRTNERLALLDGVIGTPETREFGFEWLRAHLDDLLQTNGIFVSARLPEMMGGFCSVKRADEIAALAPRFAGQPGELDLARAIERVRDCGLLKTVRGAEINAALAKVK